MWAKRAAEWLLGARVIDRSLGRWMRGTGLILAYHNVVPDEQIGRGDAALHLGVTRFRQHLEVLERRCEIVSLMEIYSTRQTRGLRPRVAITFDDAYRGAVVLGGPELRRRGLPATIFVAPWFVEAGAGFWWDALGPIPPEQRRFLIGELRGREGEVRAWAVRKGVTLHDCGPWFVAASESELAAVVGERISVGSHSWSHPNLCQATEDELADELVTPLRWMRERYTDVVPWLAYPYGEHSAATVEAARLAGYDRVLGISGGWLGRGARDSDALPRFNVPAGLSAAGLAVRLNGLLVG